MPPLLLRTIFLRCPPRTSRTPDIVLLLDLVRGLFHGLFLSADEHVARGRLEVLDVGHILRQIVDARGVFPLRLYVVTTIKREAF